MGFGTIIAVALILLGVVGAIVVTYPILEAGASKISESFIVQSHSHQEQQKTDITIDSITVEGSCADYNLSVQVRNSGGRALRVSKMNVLDNNGMLSLDNTSVTDRFYSRNDVDGYISYDGSTYAVVDDVNISYIENYTIGATTEFRTYLSFNTSAIRDDVTVIDAYLYVYATYFETDVSPTWNVDYYTGTDIIGAALTQADWGRFVYLDELDYQEATGWKGVSMPGANVNKGGDTDFELRIDSAIGNNNYAQIDITQTENTGRTSDPYLDVTYALNDSLNVVLSPTKDINMIYYDMSSAQNGHTVMVVTENGITAYGTYDCS